MIKAAEYALSGLQNASRQFESAARGVAGNPDINTTHTSIAANNGNTEAQLNSNNQNPPQNPFASDPTAIQEPPSLAEGLVSMKEASISYKANAKVLSAVQDTQEKLLEILA